MNEEQQPRGPVEGPPNKGPAVIIGVLLVLVGLGLIGGRLWQWVWPDFTAWGFYFGEWRRWAFAVGLMVVGILLVASSGRISARLPGKGQRLYRSRTQRMISGVLGGIAEYFSLDPTIVRLAFVGFALIADAGAALVAYIVAAIIMPEEPLSSGDAPPPPPPGS